jgi:hypothetical protein
MAELEGVERGVNGEKEAEKGFGGVEVEERKSVSV